MSCLLIAAHHYCQYLWAHDLSHNVLIYPIYACCGFIGVGIFFFLSGYGLMESEKKRHLSASGYLRRRFWHIFKPMLIVNIIYAAVMLMLNADWLASVGGWVGVGCQLVNIQHIDAVMWYIQILFLFYLIFFIATRQSSHKLTAVITTLEVAIYMAVAGMLISNAKYHLVISAPTFALGVLCSVYWKNVAHWLADRLSWMWIIAFYLLAEVLSFFVFRGVFKPITHCMDNILVIAVFLWAVVRWSDRVTYKSRLSIISYEVYLVHYKIINLGILLTGFLLPFYIYLPVVLITAWIMHQVITVIKVD